MIIGESLRRLFSDLTYDYVDSQGQTQTEAVQFHYGDHKELVKWLKLSDSERLPKYPLLWYVISPYTDEDNGYKRVKSRLIILHTFRDREEQLNNLISQYTYDGVIGPVWDNVKAKLSSVPAFLQVLGKTSEKYVIKDEPNYGVKADGIRTSQTDFTQTQTQGDQSISIDIVDGRIIELEFRIKTNCI